MASDFPAAHSMDSEWFAVDQNGQVAVFITGENGHLPRGQALRDLVAVMGALRGKPLTEEEMDEVWDSSPEEACAEAGLFVYDYADGRSGVDPFDVIQVQDTYRRTDVPEAPTHIDQLPPGMRVQLKGVNLAGVDFTAAPLVQPAEFVRCDYWGEPHSFLASDGKTVKVVPGKEKEYAAFLADLWASDEPQHRDLLKRFTFEEPLPPVPKPASKRRPAAKKPVAAKKAAGTKKPAAKKPTAGKPPAAKKKPAAVKRKKGTS